VKSDTVHSQSFDVACTGDRFSLFSLQDLGKPLYDYTIALCMLLKEWNFGSGSWNTPHMADCWILVDLSLSTYFHSFFPEFPEQQEVRFMIFTMAAQPRP
jgi:hypothetical protein